MEQSNNPMIHGELQYKPVLAVKRERHSKAYKTKYLQARNAVIMLLGLFVLLALVMAWTLKGNLALQNKINDSKTMPSGRLK